MLEEPIPARPSLAQAETPEERQQRIDLEYRRLESALAPTFHQDSHRDEANNQFALAKTDALIGGTNLMIGALVGVPGGIAFLLPATVAVIAVVSSIRHWNKGLELAKEANADPTIHDAVYEGTLEQQPALAHYHL
jgi:hypothetical protein